MGTPSRYYSTKAIELRLYAVDSSTTGTLPSSDSVGTTHQIELRDKNNGTTNFSLPSSYPFTLIIDPDLDTEEVVTVTAATSNVYTITRGSDGSNITTHNVGAVVKHGVSARDYSDSRTHEAAANGVHDVIGSVVGTTDTQTLTNKTLTAPTINNGTIGGSATINTTGNITGATITGTTVNGTTVTGTTVNGTTLQHNGRTLPTAIASGSVTLTTSSSTTASASVTWTTTGSAPVVIATADNAAFNISVSSVTATGCTINARHIDATTSSVSFTVYWVAVKN